MQVECTTCTRGEIRIWAFIVPAAQEEIGILVWHLVQVLANTCARGQIRIWAFIVPTAQAELGILIWRLVQVFAKTCTRGQIMIWPFIVPVAQIITWNPNLAFGASFLGKNLHQKPQWDLPHVSGQRLTKNLES